MRQRVATIGLLLFLAVDVVLVALALRPPRTSEPAGTPFSTASPTTPATSTDTTGTSTALPTTSRTTTSTGEAAARPTPLTLMVNGFDDSVAWRAETGTCDGGSSVAVTRDGGARWTSVESPAPGIARLQWLEEDGRGFVIGASEDCTLGQYTTTDFGTTWSDAIDVSGGWSRTLESDTEVVTPANDAAEPCGDTAVIDLSRTSAEQAQALCATGEITVTDDAGDSWTTFGQAPGAVALANRLTSDVLATYVTRIVDSCDGIEVARVPEGEKPVRLACVRATVPEEGGRIAISTPGDGGWLVAEDATWTASRDLRTWKKA